MKDHTAAPSGVLSRRGVVAGICATLGSAWIPAARATVAQGWIDVHHHFIPPAYREFYAAAQRADAAVVTPPMAWELSADLEDMDRSGTRTAVLSMFVPPQLGSPAARARLARDMNDYAARLASDHPGRFGSFAALPLPDVDACLAEIAYAMDQLHAHGCCVYSNVGGRWLGDPAFEPIFAELNRRRAVLFVHPTAADCCRNLLAGVPDNIIEYATDTTRAIATVIFNGVTSRYPQIRFVFSHGGGTVPFLIERFLGGTSAEIVPGIRTTGQGGPYVPHQPPQGALHELRRLYYDTAQCSNPVAMRALKSLVPVSQILFGTDYFYRTATETADALRHCGVFGDRELEQLGTGNASRMLPSLRT
jgi:predicted TIM-barrel fold metal-dependent hydrolase